MQSNEVLGSNIKVLREEARLTIEALSEKTGIDEERLIELESGSHFPLTKELMVLCPALKISEDDFLERDILSERKEASSRMKKSHDKDDFTWYYGDKKRMLFYIIAVVAIILGGFLTSFYFYSVKYLDILAQELVAEPELQLPVLDQICMQIGYIGYAVYGAAFATGVCIVIEIYRKTNLKPQWWHFMILLSGSGIIYAIGIIACIPFIFYCLFEIIFKHGKARVK